MCVSECVCVEGGGGVCECVSVSMCVCVSVCVRACVRVHNHIARQTHNIDRVKLLYHSRTPSPSPLPLPCPYPPPHHPTTPTPTPTHHNLQRTVVNKDRQSPSRVSTRYELLSWSMCSNCHRGLRTDGETCLRLPSASTYIRWFLAGSQLH